MWRDGGQSVPLRHITLITLFWAGLVMLLASSGRSAPITPIQRIKERGHLIVAMMGDTHYPFFYEDEAGQLRGADVDLARGLAEALGVELVLNREADTFDAVVRQIARGEADVAVSMLSITLPRAEQVLYTRPYVTLKQALMINRVGLAASKQEVHDPVTLLNDLGARIGVLAGSSYIRFASSLFPRAEIIGFPDRRRLYDAVQRGDVLAVHFDENQIKQFIFEEPRRLIPLQVIILDAYEDLIAMAVAPENPQLLEWLNTYLRLNRVDWTIDDLLARYRRPGD